MNNSFKNAAKAGENDEGKRADRIIRTVLSDMPLSSVYKEIRRGRIRINGKKIKPDCRVSRGDIISVHNSLLKTDKDNTPENALKSEGFLTENTQPADKTWRIRQDMQDRRDLQTENRVKETLISSIIFENNNILALNKKRGMPVHGGDFSEETETLENCVKLYLEGKIPDSITFSPGPLHRLDRNTSGIILFGKSIAGARVFSEMLRSDMTEKYYIALFDGMIKKEAVWKNRIEQDRKRKYSASADNFIPDTEQRNKAGDETADNKLTPGKQAVTIVRPVVFNDKYTLALVKIPTGRYHQIRKQGQLNRHSLSGDRKYGGEKSIPFYLLHSFCLVLKEESGITGFKSLTAPLPGYFYKTAEKLFSPGDMEIFIEFIRNFKQIPD